MKSHWFPMFAASLSVLWALYAFWPLYQGHKVEWLLMLLLSTAWMGLAFIASER